MFSNRTCAIFMASFLAIQTPAVARDQLTIENVIETRRLIDGRVASTYARDLRGDDRAIRYSPDRRRYAVLMMRGDLSRNGNWLEVLSGDLTDPVSAASPSIVARLLMTSLGAPGGGYGTSGLTTNTGFNQIGWVDNENIALLWGDAQNISQVVSINIVNGEVNWLTESPTDVVLFAIGPSRELVYAASVRRNDALNERLNSSGFFVQNQDVSGLISGSLDGTGFFDRVGNVEFFYQRPGEIRRQIRFGAHGLSRTPPVVLSISPDGRRAIFSATAPSAPENWAAYNSEPFRLKLTSYRREGPASPLGRALSVFMIADLETFTARQLWEAPAPSAAPAVIWTANGRHILFGPTFLPISDENPFGRQGTAFVELDTQSNKFVDIPVPDDFRRSGTNLNFRSPRVLEVRAGDREVFLRKHRQRWSSMPPPVASSEPASPTPFSIILQEGMNEPPKIVVRDSTNRETVAFDLNPDLIQRFSLGRVEPHAWTDSVGRTWTGRLYYPVGYEAGRRYPLVIQTHGHASPGRFSLTGRQLGLGTTDSVYAAQVLSNLEIAVLQIQDRSERGITATPNEPAMYADAYERALQSSPITELADMNRVGLLGYSRTGWHVQYALTHSAFRYAAAVVADPTDPSYVTAAALGWPQEFASDNGAEPFGSGLNQWLRQSPGFNADRVSAPLLLIHHQGGLWGTLTIWEMFSRLRHLSRPVDAFVAPDIDRATHALQNPYQVLRTQSVAVAWFDFWLKAGDGRMVDDSEVIDRWRRMRDAREGETGQLREAR